MPAKPNFRPVHDGPFNVRFLRVKLIIAELAARSRYVSREFAFIILELIHNFGWKQIETAELLADGRPMASTLASKFGELPEILLLWEGYYLLDARGEELRNLGCHKHILCDDLHWWNEQMRRSKNRALSAFDTILSTYGYVFDEYYPDLAREKRVVWIPHSASPDFLLPYNARPRNAVFLSGAINHLYPLRQQMRMLFEQSACPIVYHQHPGYHCSFDFGRDERIGRGYAQRINEYRAAFTDSLKYKYVVAKYFEIPATGSLLLADGAVSECLSRIGFNENVHYVPVSSEDLQEKIEYVLDENNRVQIDEIRKRGQQLVWQRHKTSDRARLIDETCRERRESSPGSSRSSGSSGIGT